jgi:hypothetical protein
MGDTPAGGAASTEGASSIVGKVPDPKEKPGDGGKPDEGKKPDEGGTPDAGKKPDEGKPKGDEGKPEGKDGKSADRGGAPDGAPASYDLKLPEGDYVDGTVRTEIEKRAKALGLSNEDAQTYLDDVATSLKAQSEAFFEETSKDPTYGGDNLAETQRLARAGINAIFPKGDPLRDRFLGVVNRGGIFNELSVVAALARVGRMNAEDSPAGGKAPAGGGGQSMEDKLYDNPTSKPKE